MASPIQQKSSVNHSASKGGKAQPPEDDPCTERCRSKVHGRKIWEIALGGEPTEVVCLWAKTCLNYASVKDDFGRTALHAAASTGNLKAVEWLIKTQQCNINAKDSISGYTALHRSIYFGHLQVSRSLIKHGADVNIRDNEGLTPFELCQMDRPKLFLQHRGDMTELTVWGSNANYNLGLGHQQPRLHPDVVPEFRRAEMSLTKVEMNTYHTIFLTQAGKAYACGYGMGGRLGTGDDEVVLNPTQVHLRNNGPCRDVAVGQDHSIFLTDTKVWTVGSNEFGQLGMGQNMGQLTHLKNPRTVDALQKHGIMGILAGSFHSCFYNAELVLVCGLNQGQFGKGFDNNILAPSKLRLSLDKVDNGSITSVGGNEFSTAVCIERRHVFLLRRHQCVRIDSRNTTSQEILKIQASGDKSNVTLFMLTGSGRVLVWRESLSKTVTANESKGAFTRLVFSNSRLLDVKDFSVSLSSLVVITSTGEAYKAGWNCSNPPSIVGHMEERYGQTAAADFQIAVRQRRGKKEEESPHLALELMKVKRVPNVYTGLAVSSDLKGNNFTILQRHPMMDVTDIPLVNETNMLNDLKTLYEEAYLEDNVSDVVFEVGSFHKFPAHRLILSTKSQVFASILEQHANSTEPPIQIQVTNKLFGVDPSKCLSIEEPKVFQAILDMIYTRKCSWVSLEFMENFFESAKPEGKRKGKYADLLKELSRFKGLCRVLGLGDCESIISRYHSDLEGQWETVVNEGQQPLFKLNQYLDDTSDTAFSLEVGKPFSDVVLESTDKTLFEVNKCMLVARLEYFKSLFSMNWQDQGQSGSASQKSKILLPFSSRALSLLLKWVYTNKAPLKEADTELICETLGCSDYVMTDNLVELCESEVISRINLKNVVDILVFAWKHNGAQLKNTCFDFISLSLTAMLENKLLDSLPLELVVELSAYYRRSQRDFRSLYRDLEKCGKAPDHSEYEEALKDTAEDMLENLETIEDADEATIMKKSQTKGGRSRVRLRSRTYSESETVTEHKEQSVVANTPEESVTVKAMGAAPTQRSTNPSVNTPTTAGTGPSPGTSTQLRKYVVPLPRNTASFLEKTPEKNKAPVRTDDFPTLGFANSPSPQGQMAPKKTLLGKVTSPTNTTPPRATTSTSTPSSAGASGGGGGGSGRKKTKWRPLKSGSDIKAQIAPEVSHTPAISIVPEEPSSGPSLTADGRDRNNPWKMKKSPKTPKVEFKSIVEDEVEKKRNFEKAISKSLPMMQIEDEAINRLTARYSNEDTRDFIELITVERVVTSNFSVPTWVQHPGAIH